MQNPHSNSILPMVALRGRPKSGKGRSIQLENPAIAGFSIDCLCGLVYDSELYQIGEV